MEKQEYIIKVSELTKKYYIFDKDYQVLQWIFTGHGISKEKKALKNISFGVQKGDVIGVIGKNGSGKSTLMQIIAGITFPTS